MPWDQKIVPDAFLASALSAAGAASAGGRDAAFMAHVQTGLGTSWLRQLLRDDIVVYEGSGTGLIPFTGRTFTVPPAVKVSISNADIDTGEWVHRVISATDPSKYVANLVTPVSGAGPGFLSGSLVSPNDVDWGLSTITGPAIDSLSVSLDPPTNIANTSFTLSMTVAGDVPAGSLVLLQWSDNESSGPWRPSETPPAGLGVFTANFTGAPQGSVIYYRGFVFTRVIGGSDIIHAQTPNASFSTTGTIAPGPVPATSLVEAYATCMTSLNDFPPGNSGGQASFENSTWPFSNYFQTRPYGSNIDPLRFGQFETAVGTSSPGFIITRNGTRNGTIYTMWPWIMGPKGHLNAQGNWRVQVRDFQAAVKLGALTNPWQLIYGPAQMPSYGLNNLGGLRIGALLDNFQNSDGRPLFDPNTNPVEARIEPSGGVSFRNFSITTTDFQIEPNVPAPDQAAAQLGPLGVNPDNCVAFAGCYWGRIIPDTGSGPVPSGLLIGGMLGVDFYDSGGRVGTPGQSRLVQLTTDWKPIVMAFVLDPATSGPRQPFNPADTGSWLTANPPPFI